jgi:valyl-tRNA synthetase
VAVDEPGKCEKCSSGNIERDPDVLDTWFSSWLWPFSTMGWPEKSEDIKTYYPTDVLVTAPEIIFFWVARMIMAGFEFLGEKPFSHVFIHGIVRDDKGRKMSKSLGNSLDPLQVIQDYGADALRFTLVANTPQGKDVYLKKEKMADGHETYPTFEMGRNFCNKLWNASRFVMQNLEDFEVGETDIKKLKLGLPDRWILSRLAMTSEEVESNYSKYRLNDVAQTLFHFIKDDYCDWYVEIKKHVMYNSPENEDVYAAKYLLLYVLSNILKMLHPVIPFITEEIWTMLVPLATLKEVHDNKYLILAGTFVSESAWINHRINGQFELMQEIVVALRRMRKESNVPLGKNVEVRIRTRDSEQKESILTVSDYIKYFGKVEKLEISPELSKPKLAKSEVLSGMEIFLVLEGLIDVQEEKTKKEEEIKKLRSQIVKLRVKLQNRDFQSRAPKEVVEKEKGKLKSAMENLEKTEKSLSALNSA